MATEKTVKVSLSEFDSMRDELKVLREENKTLNAKVSRIEVALKDEPKATQTMTFPDLNFDAFVYKNPSGSYGYSPTFLR